MNKGKLATSIEIKEIISAGRAPVYYFSDTGYDGFSVIETTLEDKGEIDGHQKQSINHEGNMT